ncbi:hypothetical protein [Bacillus niameyensis]|nr:hypothetical protein [Bacillus niameyensis]
MKKKEKGQPFKEEFGMELGDVNAAKFYELQSQKKDTKEKNPNEGCRE